MKKNYGITLIALIITIIVMLILVAVTVSVLINSGLIGKAKKAKDDTQSAYAEESRLGDSININGTVYNSIDEIVQSGTGYGLKGTYFVGEKSIGKIEAGEEDNSQRANWDASKNGYVFQTGHFLYAENYEYYDPVTDSMVTANVYLCWDRNVTINNVDDIGLAVTWDIFSTSGAFLGYGNDAQA